MNWKGEVVEVVMDVGWIGGVLIEILKWFVRNSILYFCRGVVGFYIRMVVVSWLGI